MHPMIHMLFVHVASFEFKNDVSAEVDTCPNIRLFGRQGQQTWGDLVIMIQLFVSFS